MKAEELKEKARRHEQKEEWQKALDLYRNALKMHPEDEPADINLYNRVGDIQTRLGQIEGAVGMYEKAIELYLEAELPNNAIAICKKVLRNLPDRHVFLLRMGQIRGKQGFLTDARQSFLTYAERVTAQGDLESAMSALVEFADLSPEDVEIRLGVAAQLESHGRTGEAIAQYSEAYRRLGIMERDAEAEGVAAKLSEMAPDLLLPDLRSVRSGAAAEAIPEPSFADGGFGGFTLGSGVERVSAPGLPEVAVEFGEITLPGGEEEKEEAGVGGLGEEPGEFAVGVVGEEVPSSLAMEEALEEAAAEEEAEPLPLLGEEEEEEEEPFPTFGFADEVAREAEVLPGFGVEPAEEVEPLPLLGFEEEAAGEPLPTFGFLEEPAEEAVAAGPAPAEVDFGEADKGDREGREYIEAVVDLPELDLGLGDFSADGEERGESPEAPAAEAVEEAIEEAAFEPAPEPEERPVLPEAEAPAATHQDAAAQGNLDLAMDLVRAKIVAEPDSVEHHQRLVEYAFRKADHSVLVVAYLELAGCLTRTGAPVKAKAVYQQVLSLSPGHEGARAALLSLEGRTPSRPVTQVASSQEYVDLGAMVLGDDTGKTTRWKVTADAPSGDDQADFAKMLNQFKKKVAEHVDAEDVAAHHDLGTAYLEMGLFEEAISEFQMALRAKPDHLPTFEVMGRCWREMGKPDMAVRTLTRALEVEYEVEDELIGIYYLMGRAKEDLGNREDAVEFYEKVFSLDINFVDVTERLRALR